MRMLCQFIHVLLTEIVKDGHFVQDDFCISAPQICRLISLLFWLTPVNVMGKEESPSMSCLWAHLTPFRHCRQQDCVICHVLKHVLFLLCGLMRPSSRISWQHYCTHSSPMYPQFLQLRCLHSFPFCVPFKFFALLICIYKNSHCHSGILGLSTQLTYLISQGVSIDLCLCVGLY